MQDLHSTAAGLVEMADAPNYLSTTMLKALVEIEAKTTRQTGPLAGCPREELPYYESTLKALRSRRLLGKNQDRPHVTQAGRLVLAAYRLGVHRGTERGYRIASSDTTSGVCCVHQCGRTASSA